MSLLAQAIQEYLKEHHPNWEIVEYASDFMGVFERALCMRLYINIYRETNNICLSSDSLQCGIDQHVYCDEATILTQLTKMICGL